jgi:phosphoribosylanthranilate isomerase
MRIKVCGLKYKENIMQIAALKPDMMGFIFYEGSERFVGEDFEMPLIPFEIKKVGVFVNASATFIIDKINEHKLDLIQLHGNENPSFCEVLNHLIPVIKAFGVDSNFDLKSTEAYKDCCDYFLFDTKTAEYGGSGKQFDWNLLAKYDNSVPFFLSGGLGPEEIDRLKEVDLKMYAIDVNSKFETERGVKDVEKISDLKFQMNTFNAKKENV